MVAVLLVVSPALSQNLTCFNQFTWLAAPTVDGRIDTDMGWTNSFRYVFYNGTTTQDVIIQAIKDNCNVYLSFQVSNDGDFDLGDEIVLVIDPDGSQNQSNYRRIQIHPNPNSTIGYNLDPVTPAYYAGYNSTTDSWTTQTETNPSTSACLGSPASGNHPAWQTKVGHPSVGTWNVEMSIPTGPDVTGPQFGINFSGTFGFYLDTLVANEAILDTGGIPCTTNGDCPVTEFSWPSNVSLCMGTPNLLDCDDTKTPPRANWGTAVLFPGPPANTPCKGLYIDSNDIYTNNGPFPSDVMLLDQPGTSTANIFSANVHNNSGGAVNNVVATFRIEDFFGISAKWDTIPTGSNPTPPQNVPTTGLTFSTSPWVGPSGPSYTTYCPTKIPTDPTCHLHQCIRVDLQTPPNVNAVLANDSFWRNMNFNVPTSRVKLFAEINGNGYPRSQNATSQQFDLRVFTKEKVFKGGEREGEISQLTLEVQACRHTGQYMKINKNRYELCQSVGGYGHVLRHNGPVVKWNQSLTADGNTMTKVAQNVYRLQVPLQAPQNGVVNVATDVEPNEGGGGGGGVHCCGKARSPVTPFASLLGILAVGLVSYRRKNRKS